MARYKEWNREEVLDRALEVFWCRGYEATSIQDLVDSTGVNRASLYDTFRGKHELFLAAMERYERVWVSRIVEALEASSPVLPIVRRIFDELVDQATACVDRKGCLLTNVAVELAPHDPETAARVASNFQRVEEAFERALARAQASGEIGPGQTPRALARFLTSSLQGLRVVTKVSPDRDALRDVVEVTLTAVA